MSGFYGSISDNSALFVSHTVFIVFIIIDHLHGIVNAIKTGANNARSERLNGAIQELKVIGRGYRNNDNFKIDIFFYGNLDLVSHNS
jgi:hypothetical protein